MKRAKGQQVILSKGPTLSFLLALLLCLGPAALLLCAQGEPPGQQLPKFQGQTTQEYNERLEQLRKMLAGQTPQAQASDYRIGPEDLLEISVFEAPELNRSVRVSAAGEISLPLLGAVRAAGLTPRELESVLQELLRRTYMKDPHVSVFVREVQSHTVSVVGAVKKPGVFQIRGTKTLLEVLSMAEGLADDAGDTVLVMKGAGFPVLREPAGEKPEGQAAENSSPASDGARAGEMPAAPEARNGSETAEVNLKSLLESGDPRYNLPVFPGDIVKVARAGIVYVVGEVRKPGGFVLKSNENISVLQALALAEGLTRTSAQGQARIIRTDEKTGQRTEIALHLSKILAGKAPDPVLHPRDIVFVPNSASRSALYRSADTALAIVTGVVIFRR